MHKLTKPSTQIARGMRRVAASSRRDFIMNRDLLPEPETSPILPFPFGGKTTRGGKTFRTGRLFAHS
ncbi:hypothetical protein JCM17478_32610 [Thermopirellula anaerolimosa]